MSDSYPPQIQALHNALSRLPGVTGVVSGVESLEGVTEEHLSLSGLAHLPHAALRRTGGGLEDEAFIQFEFRLEQRAAAWKSLEFLAWFARDQARGGEYLQLRPFALPPMAGSQVQLGQTLRFHLDLFLPGVWSNPSAGLDKVAKLAGALDDAIDLYTPAF